LDRFKVINDAMGHQMGDRLLAMVGERLSRAVRPTDIVARIGGDEFVVLLTGVRSEAETATAAARLAWSLDAPFLVDGHEFFVSASQGVALAEAGDTADDLLARADAAMYRAKDRGRSRWEWANQALRTQARERLGLESAIRRALDAEEFLLHYQPIVDVGSGGVVGAEALIRWEHPDGTLRQPAAFVPAAEDCGLIVPIGEWVLRRAVTDLGEGRLGSDPHIAVAVNLSAAQLSMRNLAFAVARALSLSGVDPERLHLEITESVLMHDLENCTLTLETLRGLGVSIDVDDFGTGYSSLSYVQKLPVNTLKIDKSFIDRLSGPRPDESIVTAILALAESSNLTVVAEGVEDEVQHETLRRLGCAHAQGFLFARPMPADQFATYADSHPLVPLGIQ
jgi:diguanylate cyclase (GGDEF)-like protein